MVSDRVSAGEANDGTRPALEEVMRKFQVSTGHPVFRVAYTATVPDDISNIQEVVKRWTRPELALNLILTTGGTGFSPRDVTPEVRAVAPLLDREAPGLVIAMAGGRGARIHHHLTLPGSPRGAVENLSALLNALPHALELVRGGVTNSPHHATCSGHAKRSVGVALRPRVSPYKMLAVSEALEMVLDHARAVASKRAPETVRLDDPALLGCVLAESALAAEPVPAYPASMVDGYAVRSKDGPGEYAVASNVSLAGIEELPELPKVRLRVSALGRPFLKAPMPWYARVGHCILGSVNAGDNIREVGSDLAQGAIVLPRGYPISPAGGALGADLGLLASSGIFEVVAFKKPSVGVLSSGNELVELGEIIRAGQVRDANRPTILAALSAAGYRPVDLGIVPDVPGALEAALRRAASELDVVVTTGGVSMGEADHIKPLLASPPFTLHFGRVAMKPGKPTTFATCADTLIFALPGNPVSAAVALHLLVLPALKALAGHAAPTPPHIPVKLVHDIALDPRPEYHRAVVSAPPPGEGYLLARGTGSQLSSRLMSLAGANALLVLPPASDHDPPVLPAGSLVQAIMRATLALPCNPKGMADMRR
ncbi:hypothetical protein L0F63_001113 [Massospora cicadina]|nr:hypothetical protein L0F63_001113 [Massospora cicadina]